MSIYVRNHPGQCTRKTRHTEESAERECARLFETKGVRCVPVYCRACECWYVAHQRPAIKAAERIRMQKQVIVIENSSMLNRAEYDRETETLDVTYKSGGKVYRYTPVTMQEFSDFEKANSKGGFFLQKIKAKQGISCQKLDSAKEEHQEPVHF